MLRLSSITLLLLALLLTLSAHSTRPNIVFIISDDQAWTDYGVMDHPHIQTPHLDSLAAQSVLFTRAYVPTALCRPALTSLATGLYAHQHVTITRCPSTNRAPPPCGLETGWTE
jgi:arylsulfatase A-like enzyme